jgi:transmembrane sensor
MDASTKLSIIYRNGTREVILTQGQATFDVTKDEKRPFIVKSPHLDVTVLGTYFSVSSLNDLTSIYVLNGSVRVNKNINNALLATLKKGESLVYDDKKAKVLFAKPFDVTKFALWTKGIISFDKTPLEQALRSFERYNDLSFVTPHLDTSSFFVTGSFQTKDVDKFLFALRTIYALKVENHEKQIVISPKNEALKK